MFPFSYSPSSEPNPIPGMYIPNLSVLFGVEPGSSISMGSMSVDPINQGLKIFEKKITSVLNTYRHFSGRYSLNNKE